MDRLKRNSFEFRMIKIGDLQDNLHIDIENFKYRIIYLNYDTRRFNTIFKRKPKNRRLE